jgi:hypothetical protein
MNKVTLPYSQYALATHRFGRGPNKDYLLPLARDEEMIAFRRSHQPGTARTQYEARGIRIASRVLDLTKQHADLSFVAPIIAMSGLNTSSYNLQAPNLMRRHFRLPTVAGIEDERRETSVDLITRAQEKLIVVSSLSETVLSGMVEGRGGIERKRTLLGRSVGEAALLIGVAGMGNFPLSMSAFEVQDRVRKQAMVLDDMSINFATEIGTLPSLMQLGDPDSDLSVYWRRKAPTAAFQAFDQATQEFSEVN